MLQLRNHFFDILYGILLLLIAFLFLFSLQIFEPNFFLFDDNADQFIIFYDFNWRSLIDHFSIPFINFHQYLGHPYFAQGQTGVFYIPVYVAIFLSKLIFHNIYYTIDIIVSLHFAASAIGMFLLLRKLKISPLTSLLSSLLWITFPFSILTSKLWVPISYTAAYLPCNFLLLKLFIDHPCFKHSLYLAILKTFFFYQGQFHFLFIRRQCRSVYYFL